MPPLNISSSNSAVSGGPSRANSHRESRCWCSSHDATASASSASASAIQASISWVAGPVLHRDFDQPRRHTCVRLDKRDDPSASGSGSARATTSPRGSLQQIRAPDEHGPPTGRPFRSITPGCSSMRSASSTNRFAAGGPDEPGCRVTYGDERPFTCASNRTYRGILNYPMATA